MSLSIEITAASISKEGHRPDENEDAWAVRQADNAVFVAVADGATESVYAGLWADALAQCMMEPAPWRTWLDTETPPPDAFRETMNRARRVWSESVNKAAASTEVPWYVAEKREQGAFATVLGIALIPPASEGEESPGRILAASIGDCDLFQSISSDVSSAGPPEFFAWPHDDPAAFTNRPALVSSRAAGSSAEIQFRAAGWDPGAVFALATDAVAAWLLRDCPALPAADDEADAWLRAAQSDGRLRNDDSTIVILQTHRS